LTAWLGPIACILAQQEIWFDGDAMPPRQWTGPNREEELREPVAIEVIDALACATNVQENSLGLRATFGMHGGEIGNTDYAD